MNYFDEIEAYAQGQMTDEERKDFEGKLLVNPELKKEYDAYLASQRVLELLAYDELKNISEDKKRKVKLVSIWRSWPAVAAAVFILFAVGLFWFAKVNYGNQNLANSFYDRPNVSDVRNVSGELSLLNKTEIDFDSGKYQAVINALENVSPTDSNYIHFQFLAGLSFLENGNNSRSILLLDKVVQSGNFDFYENAKWNLAIAHLSAGYLDKARGILKDISENGSGGYPAEADELLEKIDSGWRRFVIE